MNQNTAPQTVACHCPKCKGSGYIGPRAIKTDNPFCPECKGRGVIQLPLDQTAPCPLCHGSGHQTFLNDCPRCSGTGNLALPNPAQDNAASPNP